MENMEFERNYEKQSVSEEDKLFFEQVVEHNKIKEIKPE